MSAGERAARAWLVESRASVCMFDSEAQRVERLVPSLMLLLATARAEARREAFEEAAEIAATFAPPDGYDSNTFGGVAAMKAGDDIAAALRAKAGEGDPK